jgi:hypothetical protein
VPGHGHGDEYARVHRSGRGKGANADDACDRGHGEETPPGRMRGGNIVGWSIADVFVGGVIYTRSAWVIWTGKLLGEDK